MPTLRNPGLYSVILVALACALVGFLYWQKAPEAGRLAVELVSLIVVAFGAKSALATKIDPNDPNDTPTPIPEDENTPRPKFRSWPDDR